jgi:hypothetical protein
MQWSKKADVTTGVPNKDIKPGTEDSTIGQEFKEEDKAKIMDEPEGTQAEPKETTKPDEAIGAEYKRVDNQEKTNAPEGDQKAISQKTTTEAPALDVMSEGKTMTAKWLKKADATPGVANKDIKPGTTDKSIGYDFKEKDGESTKVLDEPSGDQKSISQKTTKDEKIGEEYKEEGNQEKTKAPEGDQGAIKSETHKSDVSGEDYKEKGKKMTEKDASLEKINAWLKNPEVQDAEPALPSRFASYSEMANEYATLYGFYCQATNETVDQEMFGKALAHIGIESSNNMVERIDKMITAIARTLDRVKPRQMGGWKEAMGGFMKRDEGIHVVAKTREEAEALDKCVEAKIADAGFKGQKGKTKKQAAYTSCLDCVTTTATAAPTTAEVKIEASVPEADLAKTIIESISKRASAEPEFAKKIASQDEVSAVSVEMAKKFASRKDVDLIKLAHYRFDCKGCFDAIIGNIEKGLVPTDFTKR